MKRHVWVGLRRVVCRPCTCVRNHNTERNVHSTHLVMSDQPTSRAGLRHATGRAARIRHTLIRRARVQPSRGRDDDALGIDRTEMAISFPTIVYARTKEPRE